MAEALDIATADSPALTPQVVETLGAAALAANFPDADRAARLRGAVASFRQSVKHGVSARLRELEHDFEQPLIDALGQEAWDREQAVGAKMTLDETIELARSLSGAHPDERG